MIPHRVMKKQVLKDRKLNVRILISALAHHRSNIHFLPGACHTYRRCLNLNFRSEQNQNGPCSNGYSPLTLYWQLSKQAVI